MTLLVTDVSGRTLLSKTIQGIKSKSNLQLDISHITPGPYFLKLIWDGDCENAVVKFEKNKTINTNFPQDY